MNTYKAFDNLKALSIELDTLMVESDAHIGAIDILCNRILNEIDLIKINSTSEYVLLTKKHAKAYIKKAKVEIKKYNQIGLRSNGNFMDILKPAQVGVKIILNLDY
ncbi:hypothetical protein [Adhaeribacter rhizoryzae]|uniref:Uncharacterized protein n=1 Tax=Adhaeribacter rhizoryzae TaxID=2607907 RepID=A0A5M6CY80_9BACT|nr:hypothetical protein [Adhaeribacter rhizoryzae]KAA5538952.1 hypothetical protein F0145_25345 [Adhaeribacter rhizoryzae]